MHPLGFCQNIVLFPGLALSVWIISYADDLSVSAVTHIAPVYPSYSSSVPYNPSICLQFTELCPPQGVGGASGSLSLPQILHRYSF